VPSTILTRLAARSGWLALATALVLYAPSLSAQGYEAQHSAECREAARSIAAPAAGRAAASGRIYRCESSGPPALAQAWRRVAPVSDSLGSLIALSVRSRDRRLYRAVSDIALDPAQPEIKRAAALSLLGRWAQPGFSLDYDQFFVPGFRSVQQSGYRSTGLSHDVQFSGMEPLPDDVRARVLAVAEQVARSDASFRLKAAAEVLASRLRQ
jgi:hypothetical protein